ncbi:membrane dipeptidase [Aquirhabdus parva]|uniref:Membrane dipeptidase n=2 Tax=Aquirhabdus parva TaxID=2283318 RepID=A0A345PB52_9GAMM|nr:membrane dipeptidase [Aquirhabdus parva]
MSASLSYAESSDLPETQANPLFTHLAPSQEVSTPTELEKKAAKIHAGLLTLDTHLDTAMQLARPGWDVLSRHTYESDFSQIDLRRMQEGGLKGGFWAIYTPQGPRTLEGNALAAEHGLATAARIRDLTLRYPNQFGLALRADDAAKIAASGRSVVFLSMENAAPLSNDPALLGMFQRLGLRMLGLVHTKNNDFADSSTDKPEWHGLSPAGKKLITAANCQGLVIDVSHASDDVFDQALELSATPIIASHSGSKAIFDHPRNLDDARIVKLANKGGVIQINSFKTYLAPVEKDPVRGAVQEQIYANFNVFGTLTADKTKTLAATYAELNQKIPPATKPDFEDFMQHLLHVLKLVGPQHVGIGADWDGGGGVPGLEDVSKLPKITARLLAAGYSEKDLRQIWGENVLRVLRNAEQYAATCKPS